MTTKKPPPNGTVFAYPYLWAQQADSGLQNSKDRTCCLAFTSKSVSGTEFVVIVPISDRQGVDVSSSMEIPTLEKMRGGLDSVRPAFIHLSQYNFDRWIDSWYLNPNAKPLGRFGDAFTRKVVGAIAQRFKQRESRRIDRTI
jgi:hypothetical protein